MHNLRGVMGVPVRVQLVRLNFFFLVKAGGRVERSLRYNPSRGI